MMKFYKAMVEFFTPTIPTYPPMTRRQKEIHDYLSRSVDLVDLERRQKELEKKGYFF
jgi:hypothetical protein